MSLNFRCYVYGTGRSWEAICIDLDIATFATSAGDARRQLEECIEMYLESASEMPDEERRKLLKRRVPWFVHAKLLIMAWLSGLRGKAHQFSRFILEPKGPAYS